MQSRAIKPVLSRGKLADAGALSVLLVLMLLAIAGPGGLLAWRENSHLLQQRKAQLAALADERDALRNRVALVDPRHADPDLMGEELRRNFNVMREDEVVLFLP